MCANSAQSGQVGRCPEEVLMPSNNALPLLTLCESFSVLTRLIFFLADVLTVMLIKFCLLEEGRVDLFVGDREL